MPVVETKGSASSQGFGEFAKSGGAANYIEDVFSTYLYTGNATARSITNGIDLAGKGGMVWFKDRSQAYGNRVFDTNRGTNKLITTNTTAAEFSLYTNLLTAFNADGFSIGDDSNAIGLNVNNDLMVSWTFRKQAKFFDVVTYTGNGSNRTISHNLGSVPGCIIIKSTSNTSNWAAYHRGLTDASYYVVLNRTDAQASNTAFWNSTAPTATEFSLGTIGTVNGNGLTYVAYLFAHDAGGFGLTGTDNVISCGSFTTDGSGLASVNLGYEPQWVLFKTTNVADDWIINDNMRGLDAVYDQGKALAPDLSNAEFTFDPLQINATGFNFKYSSSPSNTFIYIAIRRGPMKVPTSGTSVFSPLSFNSSSSAQTINPGITTDLCMLDFRDTTNGFEWFDRLRGITGTTGSGNPQITSASTAAEVNSTDINGAGQTTLVAGGTLNGYTQIVECFRRAPSFMDVVCWYGDPATVTHNLNAVPEWIIQKNRTTTQGWAVWRPGINYGFLNTTAAFTTYTGGSATSTTFTPIATGSGTSNYVAYLFATCAGVSKVGSYTGTGTTLQIDCGFTGGARFVLIKRTDSTGDWYVWDSARGIVAGNDPYLLLNSTAAEVTNTDYVDTYSAGFEISSTAPAAINANGGTFIFLAIA